MNDQTPIRMTAPDDVYRKRRAQLAAVLRRPLLMCAGHAPARNYPDNTHHFRAGSSYLYFGGPPLENAALLIEPGSEGEAGCMLLRPPPGEDDALWLGPTPDDEDLAAAAGIGAEHVMDAEHLQELVSGAVAAYVAPPFPNTLAWVRAAGLEEPEGDELLAIIDQRLCKDEHELAAMRVAAQVGCDGQRAAIAAARPGLKEADAAAAFLAELVANECRVAFSPIVTVRGEVLHGQGYSNELIDGALLLIDAGAEEPGGYASDMTRTVPISGDWSEVQRHLYETVLSAEREAIAACVPGKRYREVHDLAARVICQGLVEAELLRGDPEELAARRAHTLFFPHGVGHLIGLDAHDMEDFGDLAGYAPGRARRPGFGDKYLRLDRDLEPGMCVTIEPGIYLVPAIWEQDELVKPLADVVKRSRVDALLNDRVGGIRIEDTICVRAEGGPEILSSDLARDADELADLVGRG
jgi:Xaa-Pro aminopeptidase